MGWNDSASLALQLHLRQEFKNKAESSQKRALPIGVNVSSVQRLLLKKPNSSAPAKAVLMGAEAAVAILLEGLGQHAEELTRKGLTIVFRTLPYSTHHVVIAPNVVLVVQWERRYVNSLSDSRLEIGFHDKFPRLPGTLPAHDDAKRLERTRFDFRL